MLLCIDIGNTSVTLGIYEQERLGARWRLATDAKRSSDEYGLQLTGLLSHAEIGPKKIKSAALGSVVPALTGRWIEACRNFLDIEPLVVDAGVKTGVRVLYDDPKSVGADRVINAAAAHRLYGGPACIVDFGTATTFDAIAGNGDYLGGAIAPGIEIAMDALFNRAAKLPRVELAPPPRVIGKNTARSIGAGTFYGYIGLVEGLVERFRRELGAKMKVIGTGGLLDILATETKVFDIKAPWLTLEGLKIIYELNTQQKIQKQNPRLVIARSSGDEAIS
ncbi:MAG: type III pantothenate kinase [Elusimicrobia bacterium]|nr:type III pantothenate kinase [Elusimicrobiota bacterium]